MLELGIYAIKDTKAEAYKTPFFLVNNAVAKRVFLDIVEDVKTEISKHPGDYVLFRIGLFSVRDGVITDNTPIQLVSGAEVGFLIEAKNSHGGE